MAVRWSMAAYASAAWSSGRVRSKTRPGLIWRFQIRSIRSGRNRRTGAGPPCTCTWVMKMSSPAISTSCRTLTKPTWPPGRVAPKACIIDSWVPTAFDHGVRAEPVGEFLDLRDAGLAAFLDDVGRAELGGQCLPVGVPGHGDDPLGAELLGGEDGEQPDRPVPDHYHGLVGAGLGRHRAEPAGAEDIGRRQQGWDQILIRLAVGGDEGAVGQRDPHQLGLRRDAVVPVDAVGLVAGPADLAGVVGGEERPDKEVDDLDQLELVDDLLDDPDVLVAHRLRL